MTLYLTNEFYTLIFWTIVCSVIFAGGMFISTKGKYSSIQEIAGVITGGIGAVVGIILAVCLVFFVIGFNCQKAREPVYFEQNYQRQQSLQTAINSTEDIVNTDLYLRAVDFNTDLARLQAAQSNPNYSISFSGKVDWTTIPFIEVGG